MSQRLPALKIAASVQTSTMNSGIKDAERKLKASQERMSKMRGAMTPALGALGGGPLGSMLGGIGQLGPGGSQIGLAIGAIAAPILALTKTFDSMVTASKGAGEALAKFQATGELAAGMNAVMLERLAAFEKRTKGTDEQPGFGAGIVFGTEGQKTMIEEFGTEFAKLPTALGAYLGKLFTTGDFAEATVSALAATAPQGQAQYLEAVARDARMGRRESLTQTFFDPTGAQTRELKKINRNLS